MERPDRTPLVTVYRVNAFDEIVYVDDSFRELAYMAGVPDLPERVLGTSLFRHLTGEPTKQWYRYLLQHVRRSGIAHFEFHCDTPTFVRLHQMEMRKREDSSVEFTAMLLSSQERDFVKLLDWGSARSLETVLMCSVCMRIKSVMGWTNVEQAAQALQVFEEPLPPRIIYTICDDDEGRLRGE